MRLFETILVFIDSNLIHCLMPMILTLAIIHFCVKEKSLTLKALNVIRWVIISYTVLTLLQFATRTGIYSEAFSERVTGPHSFAYWMMLLAGLLPFTLLHKKLAKGFWYLLLISFFMKIGIILRDL